MNKELNIQNYLRNNSVSSLVEKYYLKESIHGRFPNLHLFKYNQIDSPMNEKIVHESRGIILDETNNWNVVSFPFTKFFNYSEHLAANIDWPSAKIFEKLDGSLITMYPYAGAWYISTTGTADAMGNITYPLGIELPDAPKNFSEYFWRTMQKYHKPGNFPSTDYCFMFELCGKYNKQVVQYSEETITLIGIRNLKTFEEVSVSDVGPIIKNTFLEDIPIVKQYNLSSVEDLIESFHNFDPTSQEGYVVVDKYFNRIKVKHPRYVALHYLKSGLNSRYLINIVLDGEVSEVKAALPEYSQVLDIVDEKVNRVVSLTENFYNSVKDIAVQKDFALQVVKHPLSGVLFALRSNKTNSIRQFLKENYTIDKLKNLIFKTDVSKFGNTCEDYSELNSKLQDLFEKSD